MIKFKTLYKKTSTGKIQQWKIWVDNSTIYSESGQVDGKKILSKDIIKSGKNTGRANETTKEEQALLEAKSKFKKKLKSGYVKNIEDAKNNKTSSLITGGYVPMTALVFEKAEKHIKYPCAVQPKLDGTRCTVSSNKLFTRSRKPIKTVPHIEESLKQFKNINFDGELYSHEYKDDFEQIISMVKRENGLHKDYKLVQYHIYDVNCDKPFSGRTRALQLYKKVMEGNGSNWVYQDS